jgi:pSer/pThr/pTyr-binding forkhead associated (FHA) protein
MTEVVATLVILFKPSKGGEWREVERHNLELPTIRIGRSPRDNDIVVSLKREGERSYISRRHCSMFKQDDLTDYEIMDGTRQDATIADPSANVVSSSGGTAVNGKRLEPGEKRILKDRDRITLAPDQVEMIYLRPQNKISDQKEELTYVPPEFTTTGDTAGYQ